MKKRLNRLFTLLVVLILSISLFVGCSVQYVEPSNILSIEKTSTEGLIDTYTVTYTDGRTSTFTITNGKDGINGSDGQNAEDVTIQDIFEKYLETNPTATYEDFLNAYLTINTDVNSSTINKLLSSSLKVYSEFTVTNSLTSKKSVSIGAGSAVIYKIDTNYTYLITNYHVVFNKLQNTESKIAKKITCYLYGSEGNPYATGEYDSLGYAIYEYGDNALACEYVGGSIENDVAVLRVSTQTVKAVNENVTAITFAESYNVGETAIAIGNPEDEGISVTKGIVSVDSEKVVLTIDSTERVYNLLRMDTPLYSGNSGGGLFNVNGELIGITNAGDTTDQNVNYAVPLKTVESVVKNILYYNNYYLNKLTLGVTTNIVDSKYEYDKVKGKGEIVETIKIVSVIDGSIAKTLGLAENDIITHINVNGTSYKINRDYEILNVIYGIFSNDDISITYVRGNDTITTSTYKVLDSDIVAIV